MKAVLIKPVLAERVEQGADPQYQLARLLC